MHEYRPTETAIRRSSQKKSGCEAGSRGSGFMYRAGLAIVWRLRCSKYCGRAAAERNPSLERRERGRDPLQEDSDNVFSNNR